MGGKPGYRNGQNQGQQRQLLLDPLRVVGQVLAAGQGQDAQRGAGHARGGRQDGTH